MAKLRVKELCKGIGITMGELANRLGVNPISLSQALRRNNFTQANLERMANALGVEVWELFVERREVEKKHVYGVVIVDGETHTVESEEDLVNLAQMIKG